MRFFISCEIDGRFGDEIPTKFREIRKYVEERLNARLKNKDYGPDVKSLGIIPIILQQDMQKTHKERKLFQRKQRSADYRLYIDFDRFALASADQAIDLLLKNILDSIRHLSTKTKNFDAGFLEADILQIFEKEYSEL
ncbi:Imm44 family immunity protein [Leptospira sp. P2653]|uniref:Uncharacterized protein n=4 Tax=Leptospira weilii TaxID=28184 RepID=M3GXN9_9LEPT|nr:Imm44 family immunity protein [Leptospira sp. P2653]EMF81681.1 hypothetical protein LEP1GSC188_2389 [Leptospira weilii serovar Topaz str. LT2116]EMJ60042.1 hypothetical protein LEP1GSC051_0527 [Leptospira sp. P2653]EMY12642.1 hypothetical protein LEP1GSC043_0658 [Leptospira weilii str. Ecochallenge]